MGTERVRSLVLGDTSTDSMRVVGMKREGHSGRAAVRWERSEYAATEMPETTRTGLTRTKNISTEINCKRHIRGKTRYGKASDISSCDSYSSVNVIWFELRRHTHIDIGMPTTSFIISKPLVFSQS